MSMAPPEVNVLKVISSLSDGGTNVRHFEQMLREGETRREVAAAPTPQLAAPQVIPVSTGPTTDTHVEETDQAGPSRWPRWSWWLGGGVALVGLATLVRFVYPRWRDRPQTD
jgi:hypothetical protein